jgi:hypothetical protein
MSGGVAPSIAFLLVGVVSEVPPFWCTSLCKTSGVVEPGIGARPHWDEAGTRS